MEQADAGEGHYHVIFITGCDDILITDGTARLCDILNAALVRTLNVVAEGEEGVGTKGHVRSSDPAMRVFSSLGEHLPASP